MPAIFGNTSFRLPGTPSRIFVVCCVGGLVIAMAALRASAAEDSLRVGERMPELKGQTLTGRTAVLPGVATLGRWFIDRGMRSGTRVELHDHVITVYGGTSDWKQRLSYATLHEDDAYLIVLDSEGVVRWLHHGVFDQSRTDELKGLLASLAGRHPVATGPDHPVQRSEP